MYEISVIVPVYHVESILCRCTDSIINQTFLDFELLLVDDGGDDGSAALCDETALQDERSIVWHQQNGGPAAARNTALEYALNISDSQWIALVVAYKKYKPK